MGKIGAFGTAIIIILVLLSLVLFTMIITETNYRSEESRWQNPSNTSVSQIYVAGDGTLYVFAGTNGNTIYTMDMEGHKKWEFRVPDQWRVSNIYGPLHTGWTDRGEPLFTVDNNVLYLYVCDNTSSVLVNKVYPGSTSPDSSFDDASVYAPGLVNGIMAISSNGKLLWSLKLPEELAEKSMPDTATGIYARDGRIYYYSCGNLTVIDGNGHRLFTIPLVYGPPTIDENGNIYVEKEYVNPVYLVKSPSSIIEAYYPNGTLHWQKDLGTTIYSNCFLQPVPQFNGVLLYDDHSLYAWVEGGIVKMSTDGNIIWSKIFPYSGFTLLDPMPIDSAGNLYLLFNAYPRYIDIIEPNGLETLRKVGVHNATLGSDIDGVVYYVDYFYNNTTFEHAEKADLVCANISAYNILEDRYLWNYSLFPDGTEITMTLNSEEYLQLTGKTFSGNIDVLLGRGASVSRFQSLYSDAQIARLHNNLINSWGIRIQPGNSTLYLNYYSFNWQFPLIDNRTTSIYSNSMYALDANGTLVWEKPITSLVTAMAVNNSTLYYGTKAGGLFVEDEIKLIGGGFALISLFYLATRFLFAGTIARAKGRLESNENRKSVLMYISGNPGLTARDIARGLGANLGTIRYHLFILELNHKIVTYKADGKFLRYFINSKSYSPDEQGAISLVRREGMKKVLDLLMDRPGLSLRELSTAMNVHESAVGRNVRELIQKGVLARNTTPDGIPAYTISDAHKKVIATALERVKN